MKESAPAKISQTASRVHACLSVAEILSEIIEGCIISQSMSITGRFSSLAFLARTCKALRDPALDRMWRDQYSLHYLIKCLPSHVWNENPWKFAEDVDVEDWERFDFYASRVVNLYLSERNPDNDTNQSVFVSFLSRRHGISTLFPNLVSFHWRSACNDSLSHAMIRAEMFLSNKLKELAITTYSDTTFLISALDYLSQYSPHLVKLWLSVHTDLSPVSAKLARAIEHVIKLRSLRISSYTTGPPILAEVVCDKISRLPFLVQFDTNCIPGTTSLPPTSIAPTRFPALRELEIQSVSAQSCQLAIRAFGARHLTRLDIDLENFPSFSDTQDTSKDSEEQSFLILFKEIERTVDHSELKVLKIQSTLASTQVTLTSLRPVFSFKRLEEICISFPEGVVLDNTALEEMAQTWGTSLQRLEILGSIPMEDETVTVRPTLEALIHLVRHCPKLEELGMELDATSVIPLHPHTRPGRGCSNGLLTGLNVGCSPIKNSADVAAFLFDLFPNLTDICYAEDETGWSEVEICLAAFHKVRSWS